MTVLLKRFRESPDFMENEKNLNVPTTETAVKCDPEIYPLYKNLVNYSPYAMVIHKEGKIIFVNPIGLKLLGAKSPEEVVLQPIARFIKPDFIPIVVERLKSLENIGDVAPAKEEVFLRLDGFPIDVETTTVRICYKGEPAFQSIIVDITERHKSEVLLKESEERFKNIFENSRDGLLIADVETKKFIMCNNAIASMLGYTKEELLSLNVEKIHPIHDLPYVLDLFDKQSKGDLKVACIPMQRKDGSVFIAEINTSPMTISGKRCLAGNFHDVTERKKIEDKLKEALQAKSAFTAMVSHELRTPLGALREGVSQVLEGLLGPINDDQRKFLEIVKRNVDRLNRLICDVLDFQKLETGKMVFNIQENDLNKVIKEAGESMSILAKNKGLEFSINLDDNIPLFKFDRDKISQVLYNLLNNSLKFTEKGMLSVSLVRQDNMAKISVKDTGPGIKNEDIPKLFQEYEQLKRKTGGTGLGLAISQQIIKAHGGNIWAESIYGQGATIHFTLPLGQ